MTSRLDDEPMDVPVEGVDRLALVASIEPSVVFSSLAAQCVPALCDDCTVEVLDGPGAQYRISYPPGKTTGGRMLHLAEPSARHRLRLPFTHAGSVASEHGGEIADQREFHGVATFVWHRRTPTRADHAFAAALVDHAVRVVLWQRSESVARTSVAKVENLELALQASRHIGAAIGILMTVHKITEDQAFDLLRSTSQRCNRKVRDLAVDVVETGWLDPALVPGPAGSRGRGRDQHTGIDPRGTTAP